MSSNAVDVAQLTEPLIDVKWSRQCQLPWCLVWNCTRGKRTNFDSSIFLQPTINVATKPSMSRAPVDIAPLASHFEHPLTVGRAPYIVN
ncbi:hypothetical protein TIFTF001_009125 [Ficus carica]|uniref:Uncharacterized protein n=1 Tax=Ficus carica TaxID=3494 RepID=A0AA87ZPB5_FICCA|nr:hypothetical protein TIFTF001_009125 [Ficus carica]